MISAEEFDCILDELADELPECFFCQLNGGIVVSDNEKVHAAARAGDLYVLGEYHHSREMGRYITIYAGSFQRIYGDLPRDELKNKMRATLRHEFRHHIESLAGERDLILEDEAQINRYLSKYVEDENE